MKQYKKGFKTLSALGLSLAMALAAPMAEAATVRVTASTSMVQGSDVLFDLATLWDALQVWMSHDASFVGSQPLRMSGANGSGNAMVMDLGLTVTPLGALSGTASNVPEPTTALLALLGLGAAVGLSRRRST